MSDARTPVATRETDGLLYTTVMSPSEHWYEVYPAESADDEYDLRAIDAGRLDMTVERAVLCRKVEAGEWECVYDSVTDPTPHLNDDGDLVTDGGVDIDRRIEAMAVVDAVEWDGDEHCQFYHGDPDEGPYPTCCDGDADVLIVMDSHLEEHPRNYLSCHSCKRRWRGGAVEVRSAGRELATDGGGVQDTPLPGQVRCSEGHLCAKRDNYCRVCGHALGNDERELVTDGGGYGVDGERPVDVSEDEADVLAGAHNLINLATQGGRDFNPVDALAVALYECEGSYHDVLMKFVDPAYDRLDDLASGERRQLTPDGTIILTDGGWSSGDPCPECGGLMDVGAVGNPGETITWQECEDCGIGWGPFTGYVDTGEDAAAVAGGGSE